MRPAMRPATIVPDAVAILDAEMEQGRKQDERP